MALRLADGSAFLQFVVGSAVILAPGLALMWALAPRLDWAKLLAVSVIVALSVPLAAMYLLNVFMGVALTTTNLVLLCLFFTSIGLALRLRPHLEKI